MGYMSRSIDGNLFIASVFACSVLMVLVLELFVMLPDNIVFEYNYEDEFNACEFTNVILQNRLDALTEERQVVCSCSESKGILWALFVGFMVGAFAMGWYAMYGYPFKDKIAERHKRKEETAED